MDPNSSWSCQKLRKPETQAWEVQVKYVEKTKQNKPPNHKFTRRIVQPWARLPFQVVESPFTEVSKPLLDKGIDLI